MKKIITKNEKETMSLGQIIGDKCMGGEIFSLTGNLGTGKTLLSKGIAKGLNIKKNVSSPTFIILNIYKTKTKEKKIKKFIHIDAYRLSSKRDLENIGFFDFLNDEENVIVIEWGNKIKKFLPQKAKIIKIKTLSENSRELTFS
ncbi:tRNA (adenosine(37)-N6)-threonylcarbamoyltransferase complex ATPase subunit type 1 TsaE [Candidatus Falkowbacteria bacterium HGW-Falkowbacteria-1]|uniref:tRNA threonylcarbamoyladenosine biosynthesis protein TsaE n=1 Tax=Candidatus Falkowbacteria bacterium HGW-Falkowbacteria-1 TaxID=2013768 RepID=A0A2N2E915_9BACT|nr:MAG: tRNA (adenosine(37)-N6)-threonylcarbamoyltransferase complex ATPase subunit type 1 TsaE [Candidatus Falkowbacteria bacterium HGW-Falkowbacteria-1]